jgi:hypothetical protein
VSTRKSAQDVSAESTHRPTVSADGALPTAVATEPNVSGPNWLTAFPIAAMTTLYLLCTSRWGSYVTVPGAPFYIGDIALGLAVMQTAYSLTQRRESPLRALSQSPMLVLLVLVLLAYAAVRLLLGPPLSLVALRDAAPYAYAVVAALAFLLPARGQRFWRTAIYATFVIHALWALVPRRLPGYPWDLPILGTDARIFIIRPDIDATVLGLGAAFALRELITRRRSIGRVNRAALVLLAALSFVGMVSISTRAGLLAGLSAMAVVTLAALPFRRRISRPLVPGSWRRVTLAVVGSALVLAVLALTPAGSRLVEGFGSGAATGTISARQEVWTRIGDYVLRSPERTSVGVGFGRDFIIESGSAAALEGEYQNVRSPHNYVVGTLARLGVAGALLVTGIIVIGWWMAWRCLRGRPDPATTLAAIVAVSIPVVSLLGVVLEAPFGAIPYFWALGQLAAGAGGARHGPGNGGAR